MNGHGWMALISKKIKVFFHAPMFNCLWKTKALDSILFAIKTKKLIDERSARNENVWTETKERKRKRQTLCNSVIWVLTISHSAHGFMDNIHNNNTRAECGSDEHTAFFSIQNSNVRNGWCGWMFGVKANMGRQVN